jgi:hypothetical protein
VRSDLFHRQNAQRFAGLSYNRKLYANIFPPAYRSSTVLYLNEQPPSSHNERLMDQIGTIKCFRHYVVTNGFQKAVSREGTDAITADNFVSGHPPDPGKLLTLGRVSRV